MDGCACAPECAEACTVVRHCALPGCPCYDMWAMEIDLVREQTAHLSNEELHRMAIEAWE